MASVSIELLPESADMERVFQSAKQTFGNEEKARKWLTRPTAALSGSSPLVVASSGPVGVQSVLDLLKRIDHGLAV